MPSLTIGKYLEIKWLDHMLDLSKLLKNISTDFQSVLETPASHIGKFQFSAFLPTLGIAIKKIFFSHSHMHVVVFHYDLISIFLMANDVENFLCS